MDSPNSQDRCKLLIAGGEQEKLRLLESYAKRAGYDTTVVSDVNEAIQSTRNLRGLKVVVTELNLFPRPLEFLAALRGVNPGLPLLVVGEALSSDLAKRIPGVGPLGSLPLPCSFEAFQLLLNRVRVDEETSIATRRSGSGTESEMHEWVYRTDVLLQRACTVPVLDAVLGVDELLGAERARLSLAVHEALVNSAEHGNLGLESNWKDEFETRTGTDRYSLEREARLQEDEYAAKVIRIRAERTGQDLKIVIQDEGSGFDHKKVLAERKTHELEQMYGRGQQLIAAGTDSVYYEDGGRRTIITKVVV